MNTSEWVSPGHPDKVADYIAEHVYQRLFEQDRDTRYAMEVQIKDNIVTLGGEITTKTDWEYELISSWVTEAVRTIGYDSEYQDKWGAQNTICADDLEVFAHISHQSQDISRGVDNDGWGDQGIFWGMAYNNSKTGFMPPDIWLARRVGQMLYYSDKCGLDVKTQVTFSEDWEELLEVVVAAPIMQEKDRFELIERINAMCVEACGEKPKKLIFNGTGRYVTHSSIGDCGTTGRKLVVDFYGGNCEIGGGCVDGETEYLSPEGWKKISEYTGGKVGQIDDDMELEFVNPERYIETYSDDVYKIPLNKIFAMRLSGNHNVVYRTSKGNYAKRRLDEILTLMDKSARGFHGEVPRFFNYTFPDGVRKYNDVMARIVIAHCADGSILKDNRRFNTRISLKRERKIERLRKLLIESGIDYSERNNRDGYTRFYFRLDNPSKKLCEQFKNPDLATAILIADEIYKWDGSEAEQVFRTTQKCDADFIQFVLSAVTGNSYSLLAHKMKQRESKPCYVVRAIKNVFSTPFRKHKNKTPIQKMPPQKVYCFTVPTGKLLLRRDNGIFVTGNSPWTKDWAKADKTLNAYARHLALDSLKGMFPECDAVKVRLSCCIGRNEVRCTYMDKYGIAILEREFGISPRQAMEELCWQDANFADICMNGMPYSVK